MKVSLRLSKREKRWIDDAVYTIRQERASGNRAVIHAMLDYCMSDISPKDFGEATCAMRMFHPYKQIKDMMEAETP